MLLFVPAGLEGKAMAKEGSHFFPCVMLIFLSHYAACGKRREMEGLREALSSLVPI